MAAVATSFLDGTFDVGTAVTEHHGKSSLDAKRNDHVVDGLDSVLDCSKKMVTGQGLGFDELCE